MDDERLKNGGSVLTVEYFDHLLEQIREIRLSERRFYQKITDIYATALDYDRTAKKIKKNKFFATFPLFESSYWYKGVRKSPKQ